jgi:hypothetical protein
VQVDLSEPWWESTDEESLADRIIATVDCVDDDNIDRQQRMLDAYCLYGDSSLMRSTSFLDVRSDAISQNVIANATDAILAEVTQTKPRPMFVTIGGSWGDQQRAKRLTYYCDAKFQACSVRELAEQAARDAIIAGLGILRPYVDPARQEVLVERIFPLNFFIDDHGCVDVAPRSFYVRHLLDRHHAIRMWPDKEEELRHAPGPDAGKWYYGEYRTEDVVEVWEVVHLPSSRVEERSDEVDPEVCDGRHSIVVKGAVLYDAHYYEPEPPFAFVRAVRPVRGFWGESLVCRAESTQVELNKLLVRIQDAMHLHARPIVFLPRQAKVVKAHITNKVGAIVEYDGNVPPTQFTPSSMPPDVYEYVKDLKKEIYGLMGVSELSARSLKPAGLDSGVAIDTYNDVQSRRMISLERSYEDLYVQLARRVVCLERVIAEEDPSHEVVYEKRRGNQREVIRWREIDLEADRYRVQVFPASAFPTNPAHKIDVLKGMLDSGAIDHQSFYELALDVPDLESVRDRVVAPIELVHQRLDMMLEEGEYLPPEPYMDLDMALREGMIAVQRAEIAGAPEENVDLLRQWLVEVEWRMPRPTPAPMPVPMTPGTEMLQPTPPLAVAPSVAAQMPPAVPMAS